MHISYLEIFSLDVHCTIQKSHDQNFSTKSYGEPAVMDIILYHNKTFCKTNQKKTTLTMVKQRKKRVAMTKKLKREVFMAFLVMVSHGILEF
jgi:hypothetical protein